MKHVLMEEAPGGEGGAGGAPVVETVTNWRDSLPLEMRDSPSLKDIPDLGTLVKNYESTKSMVGSSIRLPTEEAGQEAIEATLQKILDAGTLPVMRKPDPENPEVMAEVYKALGRPEDTSGYKVPEGVDPEEFGAFTDKALELGLSNAQFSALAQAQAQHTGAIIERMEAERTTGVNQLKGEWGSAFDEKVSRATDVVKALGGHSKLEKILSEGGADAETLRLFDTIATQLGKESSQISHQIGAVTENTVVELQQRIAERTDRMIQENMSNSERQRLIKANVADQERLLKSR